MTRPTHFLSREQHTQPKTFIINKGHRSPGRHLDHDTPRPKFLFSIRFPTRIVDDQKNTNPPGATRLYFMSIHCYFSTTVLLLSFDKLLCFEGWETNMSFLLAFICFAAPELLVSAQQNGGRGGVVTFARTPNRFYAHFGTALVTAQAGLQELAGVFLGGDEQNSGAQGPN